MVKKINLKANHLKEEIVWIGIHCLLILPNLYFKMKINMIIINEICFT
jgi:hypothetical protein